MRTRALAAGIGTAAVLLALAAPARAVPTNDSFQDAYVISSLPAEIRQTTGGATLQNHEPQPSCAATGATVWYDFTPSEDTSVAADTFWSNYNTVLAVYTGPRLNQLTEVACNDDADFWINSAVSFPATAGQTYHFQVGGFLGSEGSLNFRLRAPGPPPANDDFADAVMVESLPFTHMVNTESATLEAAEPSPCAGIGATVWYRLTPATPTIVAADTFGSNYDTVLAVYFGTSLDDLVVVACNDDSGGLQSSVTFVALPGQTYYFQAGGFFGDAGDLVLNVAGPLL